MVKLKRFKGNPILKPIKNHDWEKYVYNPGAIFLEDKVHIIYRAMGKDRISRFGYASSKDGFHIDERLDEPIYVPSGEFEEPVVKFRNSGVEDPRVVKIGKKIYMTYAAVNGRVSYIALASIDVKDFLNKKWKWKKHGILFPDCDGRNAVLFPKKIKNRFVLYPRFKPDIFVSYSKDLKNWTKPKRVMKPRKGRWDDLKIGAGTPPILTEKGWLLIYHGVQATRKGNIYRVGLALTDLENPEKILFRSEKPILEPIKKYERIGQVNNVVFPCGAVVLEEKLYVYYGGADSVVCVATADISKLLP
ncbi:MAG: glycosidase [Candidatus Aenigmarchaeota archaeon]|nr:glycosidase [Candidatus Aenigmarchaeota archaeon]